ncbi:MAG: AAA family ATPase [Lachnospiraceae bacterium]|nr:AAA family ATPase [Lachnospiraceae bacterium]
MSIRMIIHNVKNIDDFEFEIPTQKGLYALTGENGAGKSTVISCAATAFYVPSLFDYFGDPRDGATISFEFDGRRRNITANDDKWINPKGQLKITGFYEGSIVFGNRFKDIDYSLLSKLALVKKEQLTDASDFVKESFKEINIS